MDVVNHPIIGNSLPALILSTIPSNLSPWQITSCFQGSLKWLFYQNWNIKLLYRVFFKFSVPKRKQKSFGWKCFYDRQLWTLNIQWLVLFLFDSSYISRVRNLFQSPNQWEGERTPRGRGMESPIHSLVFANSFFFPGTPFLDEKNQESLTNLPS